MSTSPSLTMDKAQTKGRTKSDPARYFYTGAAILLLVLMFLGFQQFYLHGKAFPNRPLSPPILPLLIIHGVSMTLWMGLSVVQPLLIANRRHRTHMMLGKIGAVLAILIFVTGFKLGIEAARIAPSEARIWNMTFKQFMIVPLITIFLFGGYVTIGILKRKKRDIHRPMMFLASLVVSGAAIDRIPFITALYQHTAIGAIFGPFTAPIIIGLALLVVKSVLTRSFDQYFAMGWACAVVAGAFLMQFAMSPLWDHIADFLFLL